MKRLLCLFLCGFLLLLTGASATDAPESRERHRITCIIPLRAETAFFSELDKSVRLTADEAETDITMIYTSNSDSSLVIDKNNALEIAMLADTEAIITTYAKVSEETDKLLLQARSKRIPIILIDSDGPAALRDVYVGIDNEAAGYALGKYVLEHLKSGQTAVLPTIDTTRQRPNLSKRIDGVMRAFVDAPDRLQILEMNDVDNLQHALEMEAYLQENSNVGAIVSIWERITLTSAQLLERLGRTGEIGLYGFDQSEETMALLQKGGLQALVCQQHEEMGAQSVLTALEAIDGNSPVSGIHTIDYLILYE